MTLVGIEGLGATDIIAAVGVGVTVVPLPEDAEGATGVSVAKPRLKEVVLVLPEPYIPVLKAPAAPEAAMDSGTLAEVTVPVACVDVDWPCESLMVTNTGNEPGTVYVWVPETSN